MQRPTHSVEAFGVPPPPPLPLKKRKLQVNEEEEEEAPPASSYQAPAPTLEPSYTVRKRHQRTFKKNGAIDRTYEVKFNDFHGTQIVNMYDVLHDMFDQVL